MQFTWPVAKSDITPEAVLYLKSSELFENVPFSSVCCDQKVILKRYCCAISFYFLLWTHVNKDARGFLSSAPKSLLLLQTLYLQTVRGVMLPACLQCCKFSRQSGSNTLPSLFLSVYYKWIVLTGTTWTDKNFRWRKVTFAKDILTSACRLMYWLSGTCEENRAILKVPMKSNFTLKCFVFTCFALSLTNLPKSGPTTARKMVS